MGKTFRQEPRKSKKGESDAHKLRRAYKEEIDHVLELNEDDMEDYDLSEHVGTYRYEGDKWTANNQQ